MRESVVRHRKNGFGRFWFQEAACRESVTVERRIRRPSPVGSEPWLRDQQQRIAAQHIWALTVNNGAFANGQILVAYADGPRKGYE